MHHPCPVFRPRYTLPGWAVLLTLWLCSVCSAGVIGDLVRVGFTVSGAGESGQRVVRLGAWTPVVVQLTPEGQTRFDGLLRIAQRDRDGDVCYDELPVSLVPGDSPKYTLYTLPAAAPDGAVHFRVELLNSEGEVVPMISGGQLVRSLQPTDPPGVLPDDDYLILHVSQAEMMGKIAHLISPDQKIQLQRATYIAQFSPGDLPDRWQGLEALDGVVWDEADPDALNEAQRRALAEWTRRGGLLVLATARHAAALQKSDVFGPMLPVIIGDRSTLKEAAHFRKWWLKVPEDSPDYAEPVSVVQCGLRAGPGVRRIYPASASEEQSGGLDTLIARGRVGQGQVVFVAAALADLVDPKSDAANFYRALLEIRTTTTDRSSRNWKTIYEHLDTQIGFTGVGGAFLVFSMLFVMGYIGLATFGSWGFLKSRGWERHNWTAFAVFAVVASVVSIAAAQTIRGVGQRLHQLTVVNATSGQAEAHATAYFGLKTGTHSVLDVWLAENYAQEPEPHPTECFLRALPAGKTVGPTGLSFADPGSYVQQPATAELLGVPVRATLKQFEGYWRGELRGGVQATLRLTRRAFEKLDKESDPVNEICFDNNSTITNRLGVDLQNCFLFQPTANRYAAGVVEVASRAQGTHEILVHYLGTILNGTTVSPASLYTDAGGNLLKYEEWHRSLADWQNEWGFFARDLPIRGPGGRAGHVSLERYQEVLLVLTALSEYDESASKLKGLDQQAILFSRERGRALDLSDVLTQDMVLLVGFAKDAGPVSLCTRRSGSTREYKRIVPEEAWTMYRIVIPVGGN